MEDESLGRLKNTISFRLQPNIDFLIKQKAIEKGISVSDLGREIINRYFEEEIQDPELIYASLNDAKDKIRFLENKIDLLLVILLELVRREIKVLPHRPSVTEEIAEHEYENFMNNVKTSLSGNHRGMLEAMVLDIYQQGGN